MARIRCIKPEFWVSEQVAECSPSARLTFVGMWNFCDDNGVHPAKPKTLKAELYPMDDIASADVAGWVEELVRVGLVAVFEAGGESYWHVTGWSRHQKIDRPSFKFPAPPDPKNSETLRRALDEQDPEHSSSTRRAPPPGVDRSGVDKKGVEGSSPKARSEPTASRKKTPLPSDFAISERVRKWATDKGFTDLEFHLEHFRGKCSANGYSYNDWDAALMNAIRDDWAKVRTGQAGRRAPSVINADDNLAEVAR